jgi:hypothetical protein
MAEILPKRRKTPINQSINRLRTYGGDDRSTEDAYSEMAPDPTFASVRGPYCPTLDYLYVFMIMITFNILLTLRVMIAF